MNTRLRYAGIRQAHGCMCKVGDTTLYLAAKHDAYIAQDIPSLGIDINTRSVKGETQLP